MPMHIWTSGMYEHIARMVRSSSETVGENEKHKTVSPQ